jgi:hypothetical protein
MKKEKKMTALAVTIFFFSHCKIKYDLRRIKRKKQTKKKKLLYLRGAIDRENIIANKIYSMY